MGHHNLILLLAYHIIITSSSRRLGLISSALTILSASDFQRYGTGTY